MGKNKNSTEPKEKYTQEKIDKFKNTWCRKDGKDISIEEINALDRLHASDFVKTYQKIKVEETKKK